MTVGYDLGFDPSFLLSDSTRPKFLMLSSEDDDNIMYSHRDYGFDSDSGSDFPGHSSRSRSSDKSGAESESEYDRYREDDSEEMSHEMVIKGQSSGENAWADNVRGFLTRPTLHHERLSKNAFF